MRIRFAARIVRFLQTMHKATTMTGAGSDSRLVAFQLDNSGFSGPVVLRCKTACAGEWSLRFPGTGMPGRALSAPEVLARQRPRLLGPYNGRPPFTASRALP
jgi:hypothetical protein